MDMNEMISIPNSNPNLQPKVKDAREMFRYAAIFFLLAALINGLWGLWDVFTGLLWTSLGGYYSAYRIFLGIVRIALAFLALIIKGKFVNDVITPIDQGRYSESKDNLILYIVLGFIFGLVISGILILLGYMKMDELDTQAKNCPDCGSTLRYIPQSDSWYCDNCDDYKVPVHSAGPSTTAPPPPQQQSQQQTPGQPSQPQQQSTPQPQQQQQEKQCPTCGGMMRYIDDYDRWYCDNCQEYK